MADEAEKPKNDQDDDYSPEHGYAFPLSCFKNRIPTEFHEAIKQKLDEGSDESRFAQTNFARAMVQIDTRSALFGRNNFSNVFNMPLDFAYLMYVTN
jgi:hypothetical protein